MIRSTPDILHSRPWRDNEYVAAACQGLALSCHSNKKIAPQNTRAMTDDMMEFWKMLEQCPSSVPFRDGDEEGRTLNLSCRAAKELLKNTVLREALDFFLDRHPLSMFLRPLVMTMTRTLYNEARARAPSS